MRARHVLKTAIALLCAPLLSACISGLIYTHITEPLTTNFDRTPVITDTRQGQIDHIHIPLSSIDFDVIWASNAIGDIAKQHGLETVYYADLETFSILTIWNEYIVHVYGKPAAAP